MEKYKIYFAPMQGYTDCYYRNAFDKIFGGVSAYYTPFIRVERGALRNRDVFGIKPENNNLQSKLIPQLIASSADEIKQIMETISVFHYDEVNLNIGCPFPMIVRKKKGAGLLPYPDVIEELLECLANNNGISYSVKMRLGLEDKEECFKLIPLFKKYGVKKIIMHPRLGKQQYSGELDMDAFSNFYDECDIPIIFNGEIKTKGDINSIVKKYPKVEGVMIGRGLLAHPELAIEYADDKEIEENEKLKMYKQLHNMVYDEYSLRLNGGDPQLLCKMQEFWEYFYPDYDRKKRKQIKKATSIKKYLDSITF